MAAPGLAQTNQFQFSLATVCVAPMADQLAIDPGAHAIGLVKNVNVTAETSRIDLTQGLSNQVIATATNSMNITATMEVYEYTAKNLAYGLGLDGSGLTLSEAPEPIASASGTEVVVAGSDVTAKFPAGAFVFIQQNGGDEVHIAKVASSAYATDTTITLESAFAIPAGMSFTSTGGRIGPINKIDADPVGANQTWSVRVIGTMLIDKRPLMLHFPKARITRGFSVAFNSDNFSNLPFEIVPLAPVVSDEGYNADFNQIMHVLTP